MSALDAAEHLTTIDSRCLVRNESYRNELALSIAQFMPQVGGDGRSGGLNIDLGQMLGGSQ